MTCERWQDAISAAVDGEDPGVEDGLLDAHLSTCASCRAFGDAAVGLRRAWGIRPAPTERDLSRPVARAVADEDRASTSAAARFGLVVVALQIALVALPELLGSWDTHGGRHAGSFSLAYAIALAVVAVRPARAATVLPVACVLGLALLITAVADAVRGSVAWIGELWHLPELASAWLLWVLARRRPFDPAPARSEPPGSLAAVPDPPGAANGVVRSSGDGL